MFYFCTKTDRERATICFALVPLLFCVLFLSLWLTKITLEANTQVRGIQEFATVASVLSLYLSFACMLDLILVALVIIFIGNGIFHCHRSLREEEY